MNNIAYDSNNNEYFCKLCGKAGFKSIGQARGHLSQCPKKNSDKVEKYKIIIHDEVKDILKDTFKGAGGGGGGAGGGALERDYSTERLLQVAVDNLENINKRLALLERSIHNEKNHLSQVSQGSNKSMWSYVIPGMLFLFGIWMLIRVKKHAIVGNVLMRKGLEGLNF